MNNLRLYNYYQTMCLEYQTYATENEFAPRLFMDAYPEIHNKMIKLLSLESTIINKKLIETLSKEIVELLTEIKLDYRSKSGTFFSALTNIINEVKNISFKDNTVWINRMLYPKLINADLSPLSVEDKNEVLDTLLEEISISIQTINYFNIYQLLLPDILKYKFNTKNDITEKSDNIYINQRKLLEYITQTLESKYYNKRNNIGVYLNDIIQLLNGKATVLYNQTDALTIPANTEYLYIGRKTIEGKNNILFDINNFHDFSEYENNYILYLDNTDNCFKEFDLNYNNIERNYAIDLILRFGISIINLINLNNPEFFDEIKSFTFEKNITETETEKYIDVLKISKKNQAILYKLTWDYYNLNEQLNKLYWKPDINVILNKYLGIQLVYELYNSETTFETDESGFICGNNLIYKIQDDGNYKMTAELYNNDNNYISIINNDNKGKYIIENNPYLVEFKINTEHVAGTDNHKLLRDILLVLGYNVDPIIKSKKTKYNKNVKNQFYQIFYDDNYYTFNLLYYTIYHCDIHKNEKSDPIKMLSYHENDNYQISRQNYKELMRDELYYSNNYENILRTSWMGNNFDHKKYIIGDKYKVSDLQKEYNAIIKKYDANNTLSQTEIINLMKEDFIKNIYGSIEKLKFIHGSDIHTSNTLYKFMVDFNYDKNIDDYYFKSELVRIINIYYTIFLPTEYRYSDPIISKYFMSWMCNSLINPNYSNRGSVCNIYGMYKYGLKKLITFIDDYGEQMGLTLITKNESTYDYDLDYKSEKDEIRNSIKNDKELKKYEDFMDVNYKKYIYAYTLKDYSLEKHTTEYGLISGLLYTYTEHLKYLNSASCPQQGVLIQYKDIIDNNINDNQFTQYFENTMQEIFTDIIARTENYDNSVQNWIKIADGFGTIFYCTDFEGNFFDDQNFNIGDQIRNNNFYKPDACEKCCENYAEFGAFRLYKLFRDINIIIKYNQLNLGNITFEPNNKIYAKIDTLNNIGINYNNKTITYNSFQYNWDTQTMTINNNIKTKLGEYIIKSYKPNPDKNEYVYINHIHPNGVIDFNSEGSILKVYLSSDVHKKPKPFPKTINIPINTTLSIYEQLYVHDGKITLSNKETLNGTGLDNGKYIIESIDFNVVITNEDGEYGHIRIATIYPNGIVNFNTESSLINDTKIELYNNTDIYLDGRISLNTGTIININGTVTLPDGTTVHPDGTIENPDKPNTEELDSWDVLNISTTPVKFNNSIMVEDFNKLMLRKAFPDNFKDRLILTEDVINEIQGNKYGVSQRKIKEALAQFGKYPMYLEKYFMNSSINYKLPGLFQLRCKCKFENLPSIADYLDPDELDFIKNEAVEVVVQGENMIVKRGRIDSNEPVYLVGIEISNNKIFNIPKIEIENPSDCLLVLDFQQFSNKWAYVELYIDEYKFENPYIVELRNSTFGTLNNEKYITQF